GGVGADRVHPGGGHPGEVLRDHVGGGERGPAGTWGERAVGDAAEPDPRPVRPGEERAVRVDRAEGLRGPRVERGGREQSSLHYVHLDPTRTPGDGAGRANDARPWVVYGAGAPGGAPVGDGGWATRTDPAG